jgi:6-phosphogluconolactonase
MTGKVEFRAFESRAAASAAAADLLAGLLRKALDAAPDAEASLVVSGGSTPGPCFDRLSAATLDWSRITVLPSDERWVAVTDPASNEGLIRARLLRDRARAGKVLSFFRTGIDAQQAPAVIGRDLARLNPVFSAVLLGMGEDGHFASLFPDFEGLQQALDPQSETACTLVKTAGSPYLRISLTLSALLKSVHIILLIFGDAKRKVFETAMRGGSDFPVEALLRETRAPLSVLWAT